MYRRAAILLQRATSTTDRQADICAAYCLDNRYAFSIVPYWAPDQAVRLVRDGLVGVVVVAFEGRQLGDLVGQVAEAGGTVIAVHPEPRELQPPSRRFTSRISEMIVGWYRKGRTESEIAELVDSNTADITSALRQLGERLNRK